MADAPLAGRPVALRLRVRRLRCLEPTCDTVTYVEQIPGLTTAHSRYSPPLRSALTSIAVALAGRAGARLAKRLGMPVGRDTLIKLLQAVPLPPGGMVTVLGVDDFALRRGHVYGTVLIDMDTHRPIDVLEGRDSEPLTLWLRQHPEVTIICRDRAGAYSEGAREGAPTATQVADRWHVWHNLGEAVDKTVAAHYACVRAGLASAAADRESPIGGDTSKVTPAAVAVPELDGTLDVYGRQRRLVTRTRERYDQVQNLLADGASLGHVARTLNLDHQTVQRFARASDVEQLLVKATNRASLLDGYTEHLLIRYGAGMTDTATLYAEIREQGYTGSAQTVRRYLRPLRAAPGTSPAIKPRPAIPKPRQIVRWIMTEDGRLDPDDRSDLARVLATCPELAATARHVHDFAQLMATRHGERLPEWMRAVDADDLPALHSLTVGLRRDEPAVTAGLTMTWSSGAVEGNVNRIKMIKRQMYGRASFTLLRKRILLTA